jgi:clan AA aspartic protease
MIKGVVTANREAVIRLTVHGTRGRRLQIEAIIDTGFNGWLSLTPSHIEMLRLPWRKRGTGILADGSEAVFDLYTATVVWDRRERRIAIHETDSAPLVGMGLLVGFELKLQVQTGGDVSIRRLR